jgi:predicted hydrocarbon binding protein
VSGTFVDNLFKADGALHAGDIRYVLVRADGLMGCFKSGLSSTSLAMYKEIEDSFFRFGGKSTQQYAETLGEDPQALLSKIEETAPQLGWGNWALSLDSNERTLALRVENSPFSAGYGQADFPVCAPVSGMLKGVAEKIFKQPVTCIEHRCSAMGGDVCEFEAVIASGIDAS